MTYLDFKKLTLIIKQIIAQLINEFNNIVSNKILFEFRIFDFESLLKIGENDIEQYGNQ